MSVMSFSDVRYVGEQSPRMNEVEDILDESALLHVDCPQEQRSGDNSLPILDRKEILSEVDNSRRVPLLDRLNDDQRESSNLRKLNCAHQKHINDLPNCIHDGGKSPEKVDLFQPCQGGKKLCNNHEVNVSSCNFDSHPSVNCSLSNLKEDAREELRTGLQTFSDSQNNVSEASLQEGHGVHVMQSLFESNDPVLPAEDMEGDGIIKDREEVYTPLNGDTSSVNGLEYNIEDACMTDALNEFSDVACKPGFAHYSLLGASLTGSQNNVSDARLQEGHGVHVMQSLFESNDPMLLAEDVEGDGIIKDKEEVYTPLNGDTSLGNGLDYNIEDACMTDALSELSDMACKPGFAHHSLLGARQENKPESGGHDSDKVMTECSLQNRNTGEGSHLPGMEYVEQDSTVALWVKWRGKWQTGIRCPRADCPLPTLRAKPTHERKKYIAVFFPRTKTYSWADMLLVLSIEAAPEPLTNGTHRKWRKMVRDLTVPRRYIMQKLAVAMLNISDQLHTEAVIENARKATTWKEFAMEASRCLDYSDLGRMLLKLQTACVENSQQHCISHCCDLPFVSGIYLVTNLHAFWMILPTYLSHAWLENLFDSWVQRCQRATSAESIEVLTEELIESVIWNEVDKLWSAPVQPELSPEWKTWKQEAIKCFFTSHSTVTYGGVKQRNSDNSMDATSQVSRKRPKLEFRRAEISDSQIEAAGSSSLSQFNSTDADSRHRDCEGILEPTPCGLNYMQSQEVGMVAGLNDKTIVLNPHPEVDDIDKYRQCLAFIEAKGRRCGRWANEGDSYCCVHLSMRSLVQSSQGEQILPIEASMCQGTTTHGNKCKHRARQDSQFCKKHNLRGIHDSESAFNFFSSSWNKLNGKFDDYKTLGNISKTNSINSGELRLVGVKTPMPEKLISIKVGEYLDERNCSIKKPELYTVLPAPSELCPPDSPRCIGCYCPNNVEECLENANRHTLYCENHIPKFLKRARNGKSRLISKDVFTNLLSGCSSRKHKFYLHQACELLYGFMRSNLSHQRPVSKSDSLSWILSEASKDQNVGEYLLKLVSSEREKLAGLWGFYAGKGKQKQTSSLQTDAILMLEKHEENINTEMSVKCKICSEGFLDDQKLGAHWTEFHKKEGRWLFRGYACAVCMNSFTNRKVLEMHVKERHSVQFLEHSMLFRCMSCSSHFQNPEQLWQHVLLSHQTELRMPNTIQQHNSNVIQPVQQKVSLNNRSARNNHFPEKENESQRYVCRFCGLKFDLLPDLGRHHQVAHKNLIPFSHFPPKSGNHNLKRTRHSQPGFKKSFGAAYRFKNQSSFRAHKHFQPSDLIFSDRPGLQTQASETVALGRLLESHCSDVAVTLFSKIQETIPRPSNIEIVSFARSLCCRISLHAALEAKYGVLPLNFYLKAAKLCSELNIEVDWHLEGFVCPNGCKPLTSPYSLSPLKPLPDGFVEPPTSTMNPVEDSNLEMDEYHYILHPKDFNWKPTRKAIVLCEDVSFGKESVPVACVLDDGLKNSLQSNSDVASCNQQFDCLMPWQGFTYATKRLIDPSLGLATKNSQLGCRCPHPNCYPEKCDHVYLFDNDNESAEDINGKLMHGRFPYDERGRIVLEEGYLVYECNSMCKCDVTCCNRVLQNGVKVKLEIFRTEKKGWAVRAGEAISRGMFVCEFIGEMLNEDDAKERRKRYDSVECSYLYDIDAHINGARGLSEGRVPFVVDATQYGNVSRFINHSCSPNLVNYLVLVESMDSQFAHIGLYASRDISVGEELAYDYRHKLLQREGFPCHCEAHNCRGRIY